MVDEFIGATRAAKIIGCTPGRIRQLAVAGHLEGYKLNKRAWAISKRSAILYARTPQEGGRPKSAAPDING